MCNYCATREARKYENYVEVFLAEINKSRRWMQLGESGGQGGIILPRFSQLSCFLSLHLQNPHFLLFTNESQQSLPSQQCPPVSPMDIESARKK